MGGVFHIKGLHKGCMYPACHWLAISPPSLTPPLPLLASPQAGPEPALATSPIVQPLNGTPGQASCRPALCTEDVEARQAAAEAAAAPAAAAVSAPARRRHRSLFASLRRSSSQLAQALRSRLAAPVPVCNVVAVCA